MDKIMKKRIEEAADRFGHLYPRVSVADVITFRKDAFNAGADYVLSHQWISVEEALPQDEENVIVSMAGVPIIGKGIHVKENLKENLKHITHWMPIPKLDAK